MASKEKEKKKAQFLEEVKVFNAISPEEADNLLEAKEGNIVVIGRETCSYSRLFVEKLSPLAEEENLDVNFLHSKLPDFEEEIAEFREKYDVPTVPGLLYSSETAGLVVKCDSSLEPEEILEIVEANK